MSITQQFAEENGVSIEQLRQILQRGMSSVSIESLQLTINEAQEKSKSILNEAQNELRPLQDEIAEKQTQLSVLTESLARKRDEHLAIISDLESILSKLSSGKYAEVGQIPEKQTILDNIN